MRKTLLAAALMLLLHVATASLFAQAWPKPATTTVDNETLYQGSITSWAKGATPLWKDATCSTQGVLCKIDTQGWWACDGNVGALVNCTIELPRPNNTANKDDGVSVHDLMYPGFNGGMWVNYNSWICASSTSNRPCGLPAMGLPIGCDMMTTCYQDKALAWMDKLGFTGPAMAWYGKPYGTGTNTWSSGSCIGTNCRSDVSFKNTMKEISKFPALKAWIWIDTSTFAGCESSPSAANCGGDCTLVGTSACTREDKLAADIIDALDPAQNLVYQSSTGNIHPQYYTFGGKPVFAAFATQCGSTDWDGIKAAVTAKTGKSISLWLSFRGWNPYSTCPSTIEGSWGAWIEHPIASSTAACNNYSVAANFPFSVTYSGGGNTVCGTPVTCGDRGTDSSSCQADKQASDPTDGAMLSIANHFDQRSTPWGAFFSGHAVSILTPSCGTTWLKQFTALNAKWSSARQLNGVQVTTWDDYYENSASENGFENCWEFTDTHVTGHTLFWTITKTDEDGAGPQQASEADIATVDHFRIFVSGAGVSPTDPTGKNLAELDTNVPKGTCTTSSCSYSLDLSTFGLNAGSHILYVKEVSKALIHNKMSSSATFVNGNNPPTVTLNVVPTTGIVPVTAVANFTATDSDGTIASLTLNWGDGTTDTVTGLTSKTHSYTVAGNYSIVLKATDNAGAITTSTSNFIATGGAANHKRRQVIVD